MYSYVTRMYSCGGPLVDGIFLVQKMCIYSCVTLSTILLIRTVQFNARSSSMRGQLVMHQMNVYIMYIYIHDVNIDASQADRALNWTACINKVADR